MKTMIHTSARLMIPFLALLVLLLSVEVAWSGPPPRTSDPQYTVEHLGQGIGTDIDPLTDEVVGLRTLNGNQVARWFSAALDLGFLPDGISASAAAIRDGRIVGSAGTGNFSLQTHAFLYDGTLHDLGTLGDFKLSSFATSINAQQLICGYADNPDLSGIVPFCGHLHESLAMLPTLGGVNAFINALNDAGDRCGHSETPEGDEHATCWFAGSTAPTDLHPNFTGPFASAKGVNEAQSVVGQVENDSGFRGFVWTHATGGVPLPRLPDDTFGDARSINSSGLIVGSSGHGSEELQRLVLRPVLYTHGTVLDLTTRVDTDFDCELEIAEAISDSGKIVVNGTCPNGERGERHVFLLTPTDGPVKPRPPGPHGKRLPKDQRQALPVDVRSLGKMDAATLAHLRLTQPALAAKIEARAARMQ